MFIDCIAYLDPAMMPSCIASALRSIPGHWGLVVAVIERIAIEIAMQANKKQMLRTPSLVSALKNFCSQNH